MSGDTIKVTLSQLIIAADRLKTEASNIESAATGSDRAIDDLRNMESNRISAIIEAWDVLLKNLRKNVEIVLDIAKEQVEAEKAFAIADGRKS